MPEKVMPGPVEGTGSIREAVCIHTRKIYDSCRDKDCIEDLRFYCAAGLDANPAAAAGTLQSTRKAMLADRDRPAEKAAPAD